MAAKRQTRETGKRRTVKGDPERVSGISKAAIEGAEKGSLSANAEKTTRPGPGLQDEPQARKRNEDAVVAHEDDGLTEEEAARWRFSEDASSDDLDEGEGDIER